MLSDGIIHSSKSVGFVLETGRTLRVCESAMGWGEWWKVKVRRSMAIETKEAPRFCL